MGNKLVFVLAIILMMLGSSVSANHPAAATLERTAGVRVGDSADYEVRSYYHSTLTDSTCKSPMFKSPKSLSR